jgi:hypothetical protein
MIPSQHTMDGRRYDAEMVLSHTYSIPSAENKYIGNVAIMIEVGAESDHYPFFELYLRGWEATAEGVVAGCNQTLATRKLGNLRVPPYNVSKWNQETLLRGVESGAVEDSSQRSLAARDDAAQYINTEYYQGPFHPYVAYEDAGTQYYFRYEGSIIEPPCVEYVHWRVVRLPVKISPSQYSRLQMLFANRLNPLTCQKENVARSSNNGAVAAQDLSRPLQTTTTRHKLVFCECADWYSWFPKDVAYCRRSMEERGVFEFTG